ncbi:MAG: peptidylprolyl isomerase [Candidatus ainarchaeum sp.]|nr:peptidylprolyl isomerase [Candidatus ainarchaeum sp.]
MSNNVNNNLDDFKKVKIGDNISVNYTGRLLSGEIFDSSIGRQPLSFVAGAGQMIKGFDEAVIGMKIGETKEITLSPEQAYGEIDDSKIITFEKNSFNNFEELKVGLIVKTESDLEGIIMEKNDNNAIINFNHKLAGKTLVFEISLVSINQENL